MIAGIDPGASGGIALLSPDGALISVHDTPKMKHDGKTVPDAAAISKILDGVQFITLEKVGSRPRQSGVFTFGMSQGIVVAVARMLDIPIQMVRPQDWQDLHGLKNGEKDTKKKKAQIAEKALTFYPDANLYGPKGGLRDGRSDALLIARWGYLQKSGEL
jgi:hypothetical protein